MATKKVIIAVDPKFFKNYFEPKRRETQEKLGVLNLSQANFTKMIKKIVIHEPKMDLSQLNIKGKRKRNGKI